MTARGAWWLAIGLGLSACGFQDADPACFVYVVASDSHSCARKTDGTLWCWGNNQYGQLGTGDTTEQPLPVQVDPDGLGDQVAGIFVPTGGGDVSSRTAFTCARKADGTLWCWGANEYGQLGTGDTDNRLSPVQVDPDGLGGDVHSATLGSAFACARKNDNSIWCWGANESGQLGTGDTDARRLPVQVDPDGLASDVRYVYAGGAHTCARKTDGTLWCWGSNQYGQLGTNDNAMRKLPAQVDPDGLGAEADVIFAGAAHSCVTRIDGTLWCWGANQYGQLGVGDLDPRMVPTMVDLPDLGVGVSLVSAGGQHTCAGKTDGTLWCWGHNVDGQLGTGTPDNRDVPAQVDAADLGTTLAEVYVGGAHTCARNGDSTLWCWGNNQYGQLGTGAGPGSGVPARVAPPCP